jgi:hypothetical protein
VKTGVHELTRADTWWAATLAASDTLAALIGDRIYPHLAPPVLDPAPPGAPPVLADAFVVWGMLAADRDVAPIGAGNRVIVSATYVLRAVGPVPAPSDLEGVADALDAAACGASGSTDDGLRARCARIAPVLYPERVERRLWWNLGARYHLELTAA